MSTPNRLQETPPTLDRELLRANSAALKASEERRARGELAPGEILVSAEKDKALVRDAERDGVELQRNLERAYREVRGLTTETVQPSR